MSEPPPPPAIDWTAQRAVFGRHYYMWQGYPLKAGHSIASITYRAILMVLTRPWYIIDL